MVLWENGEALPLEKGWRASSGFWKLLCSPAGSVVIAAFAYTASGNSPRSFPTPLLRILTVQHHVTTTRPRTYGLLSEPGRENRNWPHLGLLRSRHRAWVLTSPFSSPVTPAQPRSLTMGWFREDLLDVWHKSGSWPGRVNLSLGVVRTRGTARMSQPDPVQVRDNSLPLLPGHDMVWDTSSLALQLMGEVETCQDQAGNDEHSSRARLLGSKETILRRLGTSRRQKDKREHARGGSVWMAYIPFLITFLFCWSDLPSGCTWSGCMPLLGPLPPAFQTSRGSNCLLPSPLPLSGVDGVTAASVTQPRDAPAKKRWWTKMWPQPTLGMEPGSGTRHCLPCFCTWVASPLCH